MFHALLSNALRQIDVAEALIATHEKHANEQPADLERLVKQYAVASCVTRLYAIFEWFVESLLTDDLDALPEILAYADLPEALKTEYRMGISHVLSKLEANRYSHLQHENVIRWYHEALIGNSTYQFVAEALTRHDQNLRLSVIEALTARVDLPDLRGWLAHSSDIQDLYVGETTIVELLEAELKDFVQTRNDASHGLMQNLQGATILERYCAVVRGLMNSLAAFCRWRLVQRRTHAGRMRVIGTVTEVFKRPGAFVAQLHAGVELTVGTPLHFSAAGHCTVKTVESLRVDDVNMGQIVVLLDFFEVGIRCSSVPKRHSDIYMDTADAGRFQTEKGPHETMRIMKPTCPCPGRNPGSRWAFP